MPHEDRGRDWSDASTSQGITRRASNTRSEEQGIEQTLSQWLQRAQLSQYLDFRLSASRTERESTSAKTHPIYGTLSWNPQEVNTPYYEFCKWNNITSTIFWLLYSMQWKFPFCPWRLSAMELPSQHKTIRNLRNKSYDTNNVHLMIALDHCLERISVQGGCIEPNNLTEFRRLRLEFGETNIAKLQGWIPEKRELHRESKLQRHAKGSSLDCSWILNFSWISKTSKTWKEL